MNAETIEDAQQSLKEDFELFDNWRDKIEYIIDLGKNLPEMPEALKTEESRVRGCQSQVWMVADYDRASDRIEIRADSDAFIVRGLIALLLRIYDGRHPHDIVEEPLTLFDDIGLAKQLTPGRSNGLYSMIARLKSLAAAQLADRPDGGTAQS
jgi:cysteine desulfuration protein SufE